MSETTTAFVPAVEPIRSASAWKRVLNPSTVGTAVPIILVAALFLIGVTTIEGYASKPSLISILVVSSFLGLAALGQTLTVIEGSVDLSVPSTIGLANVMIAVLYGRGWNFWAACLLIAVFAVVIGIANALISLALKVNPIITTLATNFIIMGGVLTWTKGRVQGEVPSWLAGTVSMVGKTGPIPLPPVVVLWMVLGALLIFAQRRTRLGNELYATGSNITAAKLAHVRTTTVFVLAFVVSGLCAALVGVLFAGYSGSADATVGQPYLFQTITAVVVGGTSLLGGRGGYGKTILGVLILSQLQMLLVGAGFGPEMQDTLLGVLIIVLVAFYGREASISARI